MHKKQPGFRYTDRRQKSLRMHMVQFPTPSSQIREVWYNEILSSSVTSQIRTHVEFHATPKNNSVSAHVNLVQRNFKFHCNGTKTYRRIKQAGFRYTDRRQKSLKMHMVQFPTPNDRHVKPGTMKF